LEAKGGGDQCEDVLTGGGTSALWIPVVSGNVFLMVFTNQKDGLKLKYFQDPIDNVVGFFREILR
jgi:hypothetical protein